MNLLIVDDDRICNPVITRIAETSGIFLQIRSVHSAQEGIDISAAAAAGLIPVPDVIMVHLNTPRMNGFDFVEALQRFTFPAAARPEVILLFTDHAEGVGRAQSLGIKYYLIKPLKARDLQATIFSLKKTCRKQLRHRAQPYRLQRRH